jgi:hypothetical protein
MNQQRQQPTAPLSARLEGLNGAQLAAVQQALNGIVEQIKLKQWCVEKAIDTDAPDRIKMAREIFDFVCAMPALIESREQ